MFLEWGLIVLLAGDFYLYVGFLISFLIFKCSFLFCM